MNDVTQILHQIESGDPTAAAQLLPLVYGELRQLAASRMLDERPDHTLQATALVHEAYMRLVDGDEVDHWNSRGHFFIAAAEAMRRILVEHARSKDRLKRGGQWKQRDMDLGELLSPVKRDEVLVVGAALDELEARKPQAAMLVKLRYFAGFTNAEAAKIVGISPRKANQIWTYARAFLQAETEDA